MPANRGRRLTIAPEDPGLILFTGGTTGVSKAAYATHQALVMAGMQIRAWFKSALVEWDDCFLGSLPLFHVFAAVGVQSVALLGRSPIVLIPNPRDISDVVENIEKTRPTFVPGVPTLFIALLNHPKVKSGKVDMTSIKLCISGAAPLMLDTKQRFEAVTGGRIVEGYALTESMMAAVISPVNGAYKPGFVGMPVTDVEIRIVDADTAQTEMPLGQIGEVALRAPQLMLGYWGRPDATAEIMRDGWLYTGDLGYLDDDGYLTIVDRKKDVIKPSGFQVWPREVEEVIAKHPAVAEVGVAGIADPYSGRGGQGVRGVAGRADGHRRGDPGVLQGIAGRIQGAKAGGVPHGAAQERRRQGAASRAGEVGRTRPVGFPKPDRPFYPSLFPLYPTSFPHPTSSLISG